jgi:hypothetical protein
MYPPLAFPTHRPPVGSVRMYGLRIGSARLLPSELEWFRLLSVPRKVRVGGSA